MFSIFQLHNETANIWTHAITAGLLLYKLICMADTLDFISDPYSWPLLAHVICLMICYSCSAICHCMTSKSQLSSFTFFIIDYIGVALHCLGSSIGHHAYSCTLNFYIVTQSFYMPAAIISSIITFLGMSMSLYMSKYHKQGHSTSKLLRLIAVAISSVILMAPPFHQLIVCLFYGEECYRIPHNLTQLFTYLTAATFFASFFPECIIPGHVDLFFNSHQWFHVFMMLTALIQVDAVYLNLLNIPDLRTTRPQPTLANVFGPVLLVISCEILIAFVFVQKAKQRLKLEKLDNSH